MAQIRIVQNRKELLSDPIYKWFLNNNYNFAHNYYGYFWWSGAWVNSSLFVTISVKIITIVEHFRSITVSNLFDSYYSSLRSPRGREAALTTYLFQKWYRFVCIRVNIIATTIYFRSITVSNLFDSYYSSLRSPGGREAALITWFISRQRDISANEVRRSTYEFH